MKHHRLGVLLALVVVCGCGGSSKTENPADVQPMVFVCTETKDIFQLPPQPTPAIHPETGKRTLVPGMYCAECKTWFATPAVQDVGQEAAELKCPNGKHPLLPTGPLP